MRAFNLIKADLRRIAKDKPLKVLAIIMTLLTAVSYLLMYWVLALAGDLAGEIVGDADIMTLVGAVLARLLFSSSLGLGSLGIFSCLAVAIFLGGDFTFNTLRNKLISGNSRLKVYLSTCVSACIIGLIFYFYTVILTIILSLLFFGYTASATYFFQVTAILIPIYLFICTLVTFVTMLTRSRSLTIVLTIICIIVLPQIISSISLFSATYAEGQETAMMTFSRFFPLTILQEFSLTNLSEGAASLLIGEVMPDLILRCTLVPIGYCAALIPLGAFIFSRTDLK